MSVFKPPFITAAELAGLVLAEGEVVYNETGKVFHMGDGVTPGGVPMVGVGNNASETVAGYMSPTDKTYLEKLKGWGSFGFPADGRLTLTSGDPEGVATVTGGATLYYSPHAGNKLALYGGASWGLYGFAETSLSLSGLAANTNYDIFAYYNGTAVTLEAVAWSSASARATALALQDGVYVKSGNTTRRYLGTIRTTATAGTCADSIYQRFVWNCYHQIDAPGKSYNSNTSWSCTASSTQECNAGSGLIRFECVMGLPGHIHLNQLGTLGSGSSTTTKIYTGAAKDSTTVADVGITYYASNVLASISLGGWTSATDIGYHYVTMTESVTSATTGTGNGGTKYGVTLIVKK